MKSEAPRRGYDSVLHGSPSNDALRPGTPDLISAGEAPLSHDTSLNADFKSIKSHGRPESDIDPADDPDDLLM